MRRLYIHGVGTMAVGHEKPFLETTAMLDALPIKDYVTPKKSRRFGRLSKIYYIAAIRAVESAGVEDPSSIPIISATCAGETGVSLSLIEQIHQTRGRIVSPALVPNSVHNSPAGYLSIGLGNHSPSITVSQGWLSSEAALATASHWVASGISDRVLVISGDEADLGWEARLREHQANALADALEREALQEGAVGLVLGASPSTTPGMGSVVASVERRPLSAEGVADVLHKNGIRLGKSAEVRVRQCAMGEMLRPVVAEALNRPVESIQLDDRGIGTAQSYAVNVLASALKSSATKELLLMGAEVDELAFLHWVSC
jgi:hypothetical protein